MTSTELNQDDFYTAFRRWNAKTSTPILAGNMAYVLWRIVERLRSARLGTDVDYLPGTRPLTRRRRAQNALGVGLFSVSAAMDTSELYYRATRPGDTYGPANSQDRELIGLIATAATGIALAMRELRTGKAFIRGYPLSKDGRADSAITIAKLSAVALMAAHELYRRREQWLPQLQDHLYTAKVLAPVVWSQLKAKVTRREPEELSMSEEDLDRLLTTMAGIEGSLIDTDPDNPDSWPEELDFERLVLLAGLTPEEVAVLEGRDFVPDQGSPERS